MKTFFIFTRNFVAFEGPKEFVKIVQNGTRVVKIICKFAGPGPASS